MSIFVHIEKGRYIDSLETLYASTVLTQQPGVSDGLCGMGNKVFKETAASSGLGAAELEAAGANDFTIIADCGSRELFDAAVQAVYAGFQGEQASGAAAEESFFSTRAAVKKHPEINLCSVSVPGEYAFSEVKKALNAGLHCVVFSNNVPLEQEREMKLLAREKGLLCMGPDCGVANINGAALVLSSINNRGPFGIVGASGTGIQHVAAMLHEAGTGVSQTIGTGGNDCKDAVGGIMMLMGLDALEADPATEYIAVITRKPGDTVLPKILQRIRECKKPVVALLMGCDRETVESSGAVYAATLDDCGLECLKLAGINAAYATEEELSLQAAAEAARLAPEQKYLRGLYTGGTYMDEAANAMIPRIGAVYSNCPLRPEWKLEDSYVSRENSCVDYGEEEFTLGRPHPAIDPSIRKPAILREAMDPEVAVILLDFILTPPGHPDPAGFVAEDIRTAKQMAELEGRQLIFIASVLGTTADLQNKSRQEQELREAGCIVCESNYRAAVLGAEIIRRKAEIDVREQGV